MMEKRYSYKVSAPFLLGAIILLGALVTACCLLLSGPKSLLMTPGIALAVGISVAGFTLALVFIMRVLRHPYLILREDGISFPGRPKEGWRFAFADIKEIHVEPSFLGNRTLVMKARGGPWLKAQEERWWSVSERMLPTKEAFDEVSSYILAHVKHASHEQEA